MNRALLIPFLVFIYSCTTATQKTTDNIPTKQEHTLNEPNSIEQKQLLVDAIGAKIPKKIHIDGYEKHNKQWLLENIFIHTYVQEEDIPKGNIDISNIINSDKSLVNIGDYTIELPCLDTLVILEDLIENEDGYYSTHEYIGKIEAFNVYLLHVDYLEISNFLLVDIRTGEIEYLPAYLVFSPNGKFFLSAGHDSPDTISGDIRIYSSENKMLKEIATLDYDHWQTKEYNSYTDGIWTAEGDIYFTLKKEPYSDEFEYLKLHVNFDKILTPTQK